jgi:class 3 adenylate cyclase
MIGSFITRFWLELFGNSAHFPIVNILLELLLESPRDYLLKPGLYVNVVASVAQAYWLTRWRTTSHPRRIVGNLIGPALYTLVEVLLEGPSFFAAPHHIGYWGFALVIGILQTLRLRMPAVFSAALIVIENVTRTMILFFVYAIFEIGDNLTQHSLLNTFFSDASHQFIGLATLLLGISLGVANLTAERYQTLLRETSTQLKTYSEWLLGRELLGQTFTNPDALGLTRQQRAVLFMDIRNFTGWSEVQPPEAVVHLLDRYYHASETILGGYETIKIKLSADEVMAVFATADMAVRAALELRAQLNPAFQKDGLGVGIGLHFGPLMEGLLGSAGVKFYDVIGDTVNTAKRIESAAESGEVLISENVRRMSEGAFRLGAGREISAKGKENLVMVYAVEE